ncbi:MAG: class II glutamine amidotransferase [Pseudomonadota bacterium]
MCRWIAYSGEPIYLEQLVTKPVHSLVRQSMDAEMYYGMDGSLWSVNADGTGVGWYSERSEPGLFRDEAPAWNNENLHEICKQVQAKIMMAHVRASTSGTVQKSNCHPFKHQNWLFQHNGHIGAFEAIKQELHHDIAPDLYPEIKGTTDSETFFYLAITYGLKDDPKEGLKKAINHIKEIIESHEIEPDLNFSCALSDGHKLYTLRYATKDTANSQFYSSKPECFMDLGAEAAKIPENSTVLVSEPLDRLSDKWTEIPQNSFVTIDGKDVEVEEFI